MFVKKLFENNETVTVEFRNLDVSVSSGVISESYPSEPDLSIEAIFWVGRSADALVSERLRANVDGVLIFDYDDYTTTIEENAKATIDTVDYSVIYVENVANQNKVMQVPVKRLS